MHLDLDSIRKDVPTINSKEEQQILEPFTF